MALTSSIINWGAAKLLQSVTKYFGNLLRFRANQPQAKWNLISDIILFVYEFPHKLLNDLS